jgi:hypothetical protein
VPEVDKKIVQLHRAALRIGVDGDLCRHDVSQTGIVRGGDALDKDAQLIASGKGVNHSGLVVHRRPLREAVECWQVVKTAINLAKFSA